MKRNKIIYIVFAVFIPAILSGHNIYGWALLSCAMIVVLTLLMVNGLNGKSVATYRENR